MPLVRIALRKGKSPEYRRALSDSIHRAMVETIKIPEQDRFQVITEHDEAGLIYDPSYLGISRTDGVVFIQITLSAGRTLEVRKALFARIVQLLRELKRDDRADEALARLKQDYPQSPWLNPSRASH